MRVQETPAVPRADWTRLGETWFPPLFVLLWSTGFIAAKFGLPYAEPLTFLLYRFALVSALLALIAAVGRAPWPGTRREFGHLVVAGSLVHACYLGGVFTAIKHGVPAGVVSMLVGLQPLLTVVLARVWLEERVSSKQWLGLAVGLVGVAFVVGRELTDIGPPQAAIIGVVVALIGISVGTLYQKRFCARADLRTAALIQYASCALFYAVVAPLAGSLAVAWTWQFIFALAWSIVVLSVGAILLLYWLLRHGAAAEIARLFYLVPAVTALLAYWLFGEALGALALFGMVLIAIGVALARPR